jgi:hypothetical protein
VESRGQANGRDLTVAGVKRRVGLASPVGPVARRFGSGVMRRFGSGVAQCFVGGPSLIRAREREDDDGEQADRESDEHWTAPRAACGHAQSCPGRWIARSATALKVDRKKKGSAPDLLEQ